MPNKYYVDFAMELHNNAEQTIEEFAKELIKIKEVSNVIGVYKGVYLYLNFWDTEESVIEHYNGKIELQQHKDYIANQTKCPTCGEEVKDGMWKHYINCI